MRLVGFRLRGYRRFEEETTLDLTPRVVAIVGPNEAGKTSLLNALESIGDPSEFREFTKSEFTGRVEPANSEQATVSGLFELDQEDKEALREVPGASETRLWVRTRNAGGFSHSDLIPDLSRDQTQRKQVRRDIERMLDNRSKPLSRFLREVQGRGDEEPESSEEPLTRRALAERVVEDLDEDSERITKSGRARLLRMADALAEPPTKSPQYVHQLAAACRSLSDEHQDDHPRERAISLLEGRCPQVKVLRDNDRELKSSYPFEDYETPPAPLENLLRLAQVDWEDLKSAAGEPGNPQLADIIKRGNRNLETRLLGSWKQASVSIVLEEQGGALNVYPYDADSDTHSRIEERSDGFRSFLALLTFTARHSDEDRKLILAIDEAELHLHYNAQADLVRVLTNQTLAVQIIYTTHSAGCLPEDLGSAVRVVQTLPGDRSSIENGFWTAQAKDRHPGGFTSLLMAMGADAVAFTPARHAVITEGPSDALLLPSLFRDALGEPPDHPLGLQFAGGLSWTPPRRLGIFEEEASRVVYLTDSDSDGNRYKQALKEAGVEPSRIFRLRAGSITGMSIEDFVHKATYVEVVNFLLIKLRNYSGAALKVGEVPNVGAAKAVEKWMKRRRIEPISKTAIAEHLLRVTGANLAYIYWDTGDQKSRPLLRSNRRSSILHLFSDLRHALPVAGEAEI
jgi:hypothetical protein